MSEPTVRPESPPEQEYPVKRLQLWAGFLAPPLAYLWAQLISYQMLTWACDASRSWVPHLVTLLAVAVGAWAFVSSRRSLARLSAEPVHPFTRSPDHVPPLDAPDPHTRSRFMTMLGMFSGGLVVLVSLGQWITLLVLGVCSRH